MSARSELRLAPAHADRGRVGSHKSAMNWTRGVGALLAAATLLLSGCMAGFSPAHAVPTATADHVVIVGAPGLRWGDVNPRDTPTLWAMAGRSAVGSLAPRSAADKTCPADGWLTIGAGSRARLGDRETGPRCGTTLPDVQPRAGGGAAVPEHRDILADNQNLSHRARPGALAELVECVVAVGEGAAAAAARPGVGRVDSYRPRLPADPEQLLGSCPLAILDLGPVTAAKRRATAGRVDADLKLVLAALPKRTLVIVTGVSGVGGPRHLRVALADGPGVRAGWLRSSREGYAPLIDIAPTAAAALGVPHSRWFAGAPLTMDTPRDGDLAGTVRGLVDADRAAVRQPVHAVRFIIGLVVAQLVLCVVAIPVLWRIRRAAAAEDPGRESGADGVRPVRTVAAERGVEVAAVAASLLVPAAMLADVFPWWRADVPGAAVAALTVAIVTALTVAVRLAPWWRTPIGPAASVAGVTVVVIGLDLVSGSELQLDGIAGYTALDGGRFVGLSAIGAGVLTVGVLLAAGCVAQSLPRRHGPLAVAAVGGLGALFAGVAGADAGSAIALTIGVCVAAITCTGSWLTASRLFWAAAAGIAGSGVFVLLSLDTSRQNRGRLGRFVSELAEGAPGAMMHRTAEANVITFTTSPLTVLVLFAALYVGLVLLRPSGGLLRVYGLYPALRATLIGSTVAAVLGGVVDGAGVVMAGAAAATAVPLTILICLRTLARAHLRTAASIPSEPSQNPGGVATGAAPEVTRPA